VADRGNNPLLYHYYVGNFRFFSCPLRIIFCVM